MTVLFKLCGAAIIASICVLILKDSAKQASAVIAVFSCLLILSGAILRFSGAIEAVNEIMNDSKMTDYASVMLKSLGVGIVVNTVGGICRDLGESSLSSGIELAGKVEILLICLPLITDTVSTIKELLI